VKNVARLWRRELNSILEAEASARSAADRRAAYAKLAHAMRRNPSLVAGLRAEGRRILDSRAEVLQGIEWLAIRFPDRNAEELFDRAINVALAHCLDLELQAKTRDTEKKLVSRLREWISTKHSVSTSQRSGASPRVSMPKQSVGCFGNAR
jgi:hypothetical protein